MAFLGETPTTADVNEPFAPKKTEVEHAVSEVQKAVYAGVGMAVGMTIAGIILFKVIGINKRGI